MSSVFLLQWQRLRREPVLVLSFLVLTIVFVSLLGGSGMDNKLVIHTYSDDSLTKTEQDAWLEKLNQSDGFTFQLTEEEEARQAVANADAGFALRMMEEDYRLLVGADNQNRLIVEEYLNRIYTEELRLREAERQGASGEFREEVDRILRDPPVMLTTSSIEGEQESFQNEDQLQILFGMTLFFTVYTVMYNLITLVEEKRTGTWDRLILSPLRKWQVYLGHLLYCFTIGFAQIMLIFILFQYVFRLELGERFGIILVITACYTFAIVALGMLVIGIVRSSQQLQAVIPIIATAMAMLGGAFWPIEAVTNETMLAISKGMPIQYAMEALKGATLYDRGLSELAEPLAIMLFFGVICMGIGINLMERRSI